MLSKIAVCLGVVLCAAVTAVAQRGAEPDTPGLKVGDPAPAMSVDKWVKGRAANRLEKDKVYVVEFWATWCGPCVRAIPHLTELQRKHRRDGLVVIGVGSSERDSEPRDRLRRIENFVRQQGRDMDYTVAFDANRSMWDTWMASAGRRGIPTSFVVDKSGKISWIGSPFRGLDEAVEKALKAPGTASAEPVIRLASWPASAQDGTPPRQPDPAAAMKLEVQEEEPLPITIGDKAPPLKVSSWVKGEPVTGFERGRTYVVEFWATWCGPCIRAIPHLTELQEQYKDDVRIIGVSILETNPAGVEAFVQEKDDEMKYTVAKDLIPAPEEDTRDGWRAASRQGFMARNWMNAAGRGGIPASFIVDGEGRIAWIGHPMQLDEPLAKIVAGDWDIEAFGKEFRQAQERERRQRPAMARMSRAIADENWDQALLAMDELAEIDPDMRPMLAGRQFRILLIEKRDFDRAYSFAERAIETYLSDNATGLNNIAWMIVDPEHQHLEIRDLKLALRAAERAFELSNGERGFIVDTLAKVHFDMGNLEKAIELQEKAVALSAGESYEAEVKDRLAEYRAAQKEEAR